ncbi:hypothetical protein vBPpSSYP_89 [Pseudomonas phage vB_PpS_SYP]|nr:hypothetical protein vBPpSSYP_89 [Pseudomonas phage vB_PpS_SYP]
MINVLDVKLDTDNRAGAYDVRGYLKALLRELWDTGEGFSGKRPFGDSGWEYELYWGLVKAGLVTGYFDQYGYVDGVDKVTANRLIFEAINQLR